MKQVNVYSSERRSNAMRKENLIYDNIDRAFDSMADVDWRRSPMPDPKAACSRPGLREVRPLDTIVALGRAAHTVLADYRKQTLVAGDDEEDDLEEDVERLVWSCVNTSKVVALGHCAWRSVQMLPIAERRFYELPPLRMGPARDRSASGEIAAEVLVINHEADNHRAQQVAQALEGGGYMVQRAGRGIDDEGRMQACWSAPAPIHVHVGYHDGRVEEVRLLDTWHSRRFAISLLPRRLAQNPPENALMVDPEVNGFLCETPYKVLAACADIRSDPVLQKKLLNAGACNVAPLAREWLAIATDLVS